MVPAVSPVATPVVEFIVAIVGLLLLHVPPLAVEERVLVNPRQIVLLPVIVPALGALVTIKVLFAMALEQPPLPATV